MPKLPWTTVNEVDPATEVTVMASRLPLRRHRAIPAFLRDTLRIRRQLARAEGLVGYALDANLVGKTFWTVSAWTDTDRLRRFDRADPHQDVKDRTRSRMGRSTFVVWTTTAAALPIDWSDARRRVEERADQAA